MIRSPGYLGNALRDQAGFPARADKVDLEVDAREGLPFPHDRRVRGADRCVRQLAEQPALDRALLVAVERRKVACGWASSQSEADDRRLV